MKKHSPFSIGVIGSGWSGSGALIDLLKKHSSVSVYPYELDFWRKPNGLYEAKTKREILIFFLNEILFSLIITFKTLCRLLINPRALKSNLKGISIQVRILLLLQMYFFSSIFISNIKLQKKSFIKTLKIFFGRRGNVFVYDQPVFPEQVHDPHLGALNVDVCIFVLRDVFDQVKDLLDNADFLKAKNIKESFMLGAEDDFGSNPNSLQLQLMLFTLKSRVNKLKELIIKYPESFLVLKFEDLVEDSNSTISKVNRFLESRGFQSNFLDGDIANELLANSKKNIGIGRKMDCNQLSLMQEINNDINFIVKKYE